MQTLPQDVAFLVCVPSWARRLRFSYALLLRQNFHKVNITSQRVKKRYSEIIEIGKIMGTVEQTWRTLTVWFQNR